MPKASKWLILPALTLLVGGAAGDATSNDLPSPSFPAMAAGALVYALVPNPLGAKSWGERQVEAARMGGHDRPKEDLASPATLILLTLRTPTTGVYVLPGAPGAHEAAPVQAAAAPDERLLGAFEAIGLEPEDLLEKADTPAPVLSVADAIEDAIDWSLARAMRLRDIVRDTSAPVLRIEHQPRNARPDYVRFEAPELSEPVAPFIFTKKVVRSVYKILLGGAIGILIWGMVRRTAHGRDEGDPGPFFR